MSKRNYYTNIDINSVVTPFLERAAREYSGDVSILYPFVDIYAGTQITDVLFDIFCQYSAADSFIWTDYSGKYLQTSENGENVNYKSLYEGIYTFNKKYGIDPYAVWLKRCREKGLRGWISIRMNDCHCPDDKASFLRSGFFYEAREKGWMIGEKYGYYRYCFDYSVEEVRKRMLAYLREQLMRYDPDGVELDFQREITCFDYLERKDCAEIMTEFMRSARALVRDAESRLGHAVRLGIRLQRDVAQCLKYGFDAKAFVSEGLVDLITVTPRWATCDSDMPIEDWKRLAEGKRVEIAAGLEILVNRQSDSAYGTGATVRGYAASYISRGADSIYLFNYFMNPYEKPWAMSINRTGGNENTAFSLPRRFIVTYQDIAPIGTDVWKPLPLKADAGKPASLKVKLGPVTSRMKASLIIGMSEGDVSLLGGGWSEYTGSFADPDGNSVYYTGGRLCRRDIDFTPNGEYELRFDPSGPVTIDYAEIEVY